MHDRYDAIFIIASAFLASISVGLNSKANKEGFTMLQFFAQVLAHAVAGLIIGGIAASYIDNILLVCSVAGIGGLFGQQLLKIITNRTIDKYLPPDEDDEIL